MQASSLLPSHAAFWDSDERAEISGKFANDFMAKLKIDEENFKNEVKEDEDDGKEDEAEEEFEKEEEEEEVEVEEDEEEEFSFVCANPDGSPISADDIFDNGQIRPTFPVFNRDLLFADGYDGAEDLRPSVKKLFVQQPDNFSPSSSASALASESASVPESELLEGEPEGPYCEWSGKKAVKSNSTGFSKLWRLRDLKLRSNSDGKDAFVFLNPPATASGAKPGSSGAEAGKTGKASKAEKTRSGQAKNDVAKKDKAKKGKTASSAHEKHYVMTRAKKESDKRKSYLPYRQELLVGFFANANGLSRNVHPY